MAGCVAVFSSDGARMPDYLVADGGLARAVLASGLTCEGDFAKLVRFSPRGDAGAIPLSELAGVCLEAVGQDTAGVVIAAETAGLCGARMLRSPAAIDAPPFRFEVPAIRDWLSFAPERTHRLTTALIAGVVSRTSEGPLAEHLLPLEITERLFGHFHAAVFAYHPLPQRTVELGALVRTVFADHPLRDVLHLVWDDREDGVGESALVRGVGWVHPSRRSPDRTVNLLIGAATTGLILALLGLGVFLSYRVYHLVDLTADGSFGLGVAVSAALLVGGIRPSPRRRWARSRASRPASSPACCIPGSWSMRCSPAS